MKDKADSIKLGIDAKWYFDGPPSGNMVVKNLVDQMIRNHNGIDLYLILITPHKKQALNYFPADVKMIFMPVVPNMLSNMFLVPFAASMHGLDAVLFQNFTSFWPRKLFKIAYIHDMLFLDYPQYYTKTEVRYFNNMKSSASKANLIITISESEKKRMVEHFVARKKTIAVVYHGISEKFKPLADYPEAQADITTIKYHLPEKYLLFVGRVNIRKNLFTLIKAMCYLNDTSIKLMVVGEESALTAKLLGLIQSYHLKNRVVFTGHVPEADLYLIYANATVFCFPSYAEGFGLPPLEAMQCGVPVVVAERTAMPEVCGNAAIYVNPDDPSDIAAKINLLLNDQCYYTEKVTAGIAHSKNFTWNKAAGEIFALVKNAYDNRKNYSKA
ncbi:hypothetical protein A0256_22255 [Mucilaginibacter sp. PAMC 26640]|nr:hypothetical protein A0256_22255 [Mucilaginibacter sp. PAMC 26640]